MSDTVQAVLIDGKPIGYFPPTSAENVTYEEGVSVKDALDKINNNFSSARVNMGITDNTKTYTAPSNGMIWVRGGSTSQRSTIAINGIPRLVSTTNSDVVSIVVYKGDVISIIDGPGVEGGGYFYPQL